MAAPEGLKALILVGGFGTRLRPLTFNKPKPLVEFVNKPIVVHQIEACVAVGVKHIILAVQYKPKALEDALSEICEKLGVRVSFSLEDEPLGTAGPLALAKKLICDGEDESAPFFVFNSDVICDYPMQQMLNYHKAHGREGTIVVTRVEDPSRFGVVVFDEDGKGGGQIRSFVEKPKEFVGDKINAGLYIFSKKMLDRIEVKPTSIEREVFPALAADGQLNAFTLAGYWEDIGKPDSYLNGQVMHLALMATRGDAELTQGENITGNVVIDPSAKIGAACQIGPDVVIGPNVVIEDGVRVETSTIMAGVRLCTGSYVSGSVVGWGSKVCAWGRVQEMSVLGADTTIKPGVVVRGTKVCPNKSVKESVFELGRVVI